jgi:hypothetical protein
MKKVRYIYYSRAECTEPGCQWFADSDLVEGSVPPMARLYDDHKAEAHQESEPARCRSILKNTFQIGNETYVAYNVYPPRAQCQLPAGHEGDHFIEWS